MEETINRFKQFEIVYNDSVASIKRYLEDEDPEVRHLVNWLFNTKHNPFGLFADMNEGYRMGSAENFAGLCATIHHALVDDGDISFPVVNGEPKIAFIWRYEDNVEQYVLPKEDLVSVSKKKELDIYVEPTLEWLSDVYEFTAKYDQYQIDQRQRWKDFETRMKK